MSTAGMHRFLLHICWKFTDYFSYIEGIVRGYRNSLLTGQNYSNLVQCENIDGSILLRKSSL